MVAAFSSGLVYLSHHYSGHMSRHVGGLQQLESRSVAHMCGNSFLVETRGHAKVVLAEEQHIHARKAEILHLRSR